MKQSWIDASRREQVRNAASHWRGTGAIDSATLAAIEASYGSDSRRIGPVWQIFTFVLVTVAVHAVFGGIFVFTGTGGLGPGCLLYAGMLVAAVETLRNSRLAGSGADGATALWAVVYLVVGIGVLMGRNFYVEDRAALTVSLAVACLAFGAACWRWGFADQGALAAVALFLLLGRLPAGRLLWIAAAALILPAAARRANRADYAPPHRAAFSGVFAVAALAGYAAVNLFSLDRGVVEYLQNLTEASRRAPPGVRMLSAIATAFVPVLFVAWGLRARRQQTLDVGMFCAALSLLTLRYYIHLGPLWVVLTVCSTALILGALWCNRFLRQSPRGERGGFTAAPLGSSRQHEGLTAAAVVAGFAPGAPSAAPADRGGFTPGDGGYGGGGASGTY